jgi:hypothetical protein
MALTCTAKLCANEAQGPVKHPERERESEREREHPGALGQTERGREGERERGRASERERGRRSSLSRGGLSLAISVGALAPSP